MKQERLGPFGGKYFSSREYFFTYIKEHVLKKDERRNKGKLQYEFRSDLLADAVFRYHPKFVGKYWSPIFKFIYLKSTKTWCLHVLTKEGKNTWSSVVLNQMFCDFTWKRVIKDRLHKRWVFDCKPLIFEELREGQDILKCNCCGEARRLEVDHIHPQHADVVAVCFELAESIGGDFPVRVMEEYRKTSPVWSDVLEPIFEVYDEFCRDGTFQLLCAECHAEITELRKEFLDDE